MKRKDIKENGTVNGLYLQDFIRGFMGEHDEGKEVLEQMGLSSDSVPFSICTFLKKGEINWQDVSGQNASISYKLKENLLECHGSYKGRGKTMRLHVEWDEYEDSEVIARLESEAIGDLCMQCIYENMKN